MDYNITCDDLKGLIQSVDRYWVRSAGTGIAHASVIVAEKVLEVNVYNIKYT
jgi:hypothetical protein